MLDGVVKVGAVDCAKSDHASLCRKLLIDSYPEIRLFPAKADKDSNPLYESYNGWNRQAHAMAAWAME